MSAPIEPNFERVHHAELARHQKKEVTLVGTLLEGAQLQLSKDVKVIIKGLEDNIPFGQYLEVRGVLLDTNTISWKGHTDFGRELDLEVYYQAIKTYQDVLPLLTL